MPEDPYCLETVSRPMMLMIFREAGIEDIPALHELRLSVKENVLSDPGRITFEMYETYLTKIGQGWLCEWMAN